MCANCVAQGAVYVGGALAGLQVMAARARHRRAGEPLDVAPETTPVGDEGGTGDVSLRAGDRAR
jgi:hypothetical protein